MTTAEYAVGTLASCSLAGILLKLLGQDWVGDLLRNLFETAIGQFF